VAELRIPALGRDPGGWPVFGAVLLAAPVLVLSTGWVYFLPSCFFLLRCEESFPWLLFHLHFLAFYAMLGAAEHWDWYRGTAAAGTVADPSQVPTSQDAPKAAVPGMQHPPPMPRFHLSVFPSPQQRWGTEGFAALGGEAELGDIGAPCCAVLCVVGLQCCFSPPRCVLCFCSGAAFPGCFPGLQAVLDLPCRPGESPPGPR